MRVSAFLFLLAAMLVGCTLGPIYAPPTGGVTANLRVLTYMSGNTSLGSLPNQASCSTDEIQVMGFFHPSGAEGFQASRRRFDQRVGMPGASDLPSHMYAEYKVVAGRPIRFAGHNVVAAGSPYDVKVCSAFGDAKLREGGNYELVFSQDRGRCVIELFELVNSSERKPMPMEQACSKGNSTK